MLVRIMDRARKLVSVEEQEEQIAPIFKTDQNGNLDIIYSAEIKNRAVTFSLSDSPVCFFGGEYICMCVGK